MVGLNHRYFFGFLAVCIAGLLFSLQVNIFYQSGKDWFDTCWKVKNSKDTKPTTADEAVKWAKCEATANEAVYGAGFVMAGKPREGVPDKIKVVYLACPSAWSDLSLFHREYGMAVDLIEKNGGPSIVDRFLPATFLIERVYRSRWPDCNESRQQAGYPKIVKKANGEWGFESECEPCKLERAAANKETGLDWDRYISLKDLEAELSRREKEAKK